MGVLRSEEMRHGVIVLPEEHAYHFLDAIGSGANVQLEDANSACLQRPYRTHVQRIVEMERLLRFVRAEVLKLPSMDQHLRSGDVEGFLQRGKSYSMDEVEASLKRLHQDFVSFKENTAKLLETRNELIERQHVSRVSAQMSLGAEEGHEHAFESRAGTILQSARQRFARSIFRATRGNALTHFEAIEDAIPDPKTGKDSFKSVFIIFFQNTQDLGQSYLSEKVVKICAAFGTNTYGRRVEVDSTSSADVERLLENHFNFMRQEALRLIEPVANGEEVAGGNSLIEEWRLFCAKEKSIYAALNLFEGQMNLRAQCWYPLEEESAIQALLMDRSNGARSGMLVPQRASNIHGVPNARPPPTYVRTNGITEATQQLVNTYGVPRYKEVNPAVFWVITFPFLFGVMYGDVGHGLLLLAFGVMLVRRADELRVSIPALYDFRYMIALMGFFSVYAGLIYSDIFSLGLPLFASRWEGDDGDDDRKNSSILFSPSYDDRNEGGRGPYPFGLDPAWHAAENELIFVNAMKMKTSVILGVAHMLLGLFLRWVNAVHERNMIDLVCECVPATLFMLCFFAFMDIQILYKWVTPVDDPPSIVNSMIAMALGLDDPHALFGTALPSTLMALTMLAVPWMLIPKPLILYAQHRSKTQAAQRRRNIRDMEENDFAYGADPFSRDFTRASAVGAARTTSPRQPQVEDDEDLGLLDEDDDEEFDISEIVIHQVIETIEYVLGTVSHTASYLRLWALSLAHQQLALVFFQYSILSAMSWSFPLNVIGIYVNFLFWLLVTGGILLGMDVMECFLHTVRLHWVEFQSKFYKGDGYLFEPFRHQRLLAQSEDA